MTAEVTLSNLKIVDQVDKDRFSTIAGVGKFLVLQTEDVTSVLLIIDWRFTNLIL